MTSINKVLGVETGDIAEISEIESSSVVGIMGVGVDFSVIPIGLIIPFNDTSIPSGWERFTSADDKFLIGAGDSYNPGDTGGSTNVTVNESSSNAGAHNPPAFTAPAAGINFANGYYNSAGTGYGNHIHSATSGTFTPAYNEIVLIKSSIEHAAFPVNSTILSSGNVETSGLTNIINNNRYLKSNSSINSSGQSSLSVSISSAGNHIHNNDYNKKYWTSGPTATVDTVKVSGAHTPSNISCSINNVNIRRVQLSAWTNASQEFNLDSNMIGMYESLTPPEGWILCDGNNGSPDLRNYFVNTVNGGSEASGQGNGTLSYSYGSGLNHSNTHDHISSTQVFEYTGGMRHYADSNSHSHTLSFSKSSGYTPPYYALVFIIKL